MRSGCSRSARGRAGQILGEKVQGVRAAGTETESFVSDSLQIHHPKCEEHPQAGPEADQPGDLQEEQQEVPPEPEEHEGKIPEQGQCHQ